MAELSPMMKQYLRIKSQNEDSILFFRVGDFYEMFFDDAKKASDELDLTLTGKDCGMGERAPMCGVPYHSCESYIARLVQKGYKVAICEQTEDPKTAKKLVDRDIIRVITPGTVIEDMMLEEGKNNYLAAVALTGDGVGLCFTDASTGECHLTSFPAGNYNSAVSDELLRFAAALESKSEHPLSRAILNGFASHGGECPEAEDFAAVPGRGLTAKIERYTVCGGNADFIREKTALPESITQHAAALADEGKTPLYFSRNNELLGVIAVADVMKSDAAEAIRELKGMGLRVVMLTGDNARTAAAIGSAAGVDAVVAGVLPDGKETVIRKLRESGKVAMVGDGINDAPALTRADVGLAVGAGTDVAIDAADVVLMKSGVSDVSAAIRLSRAALRNIRENLFWAFIYNIIGIPLAAGVWIPIFGWTLQPMFGALAMSLSSFCVVTNALRLNLFRLHEAKHDKHRQPVTLPDEFTAAPQETNTATDHKEEKTMYKTTVSVEGMMCHMCEKHVNEAVSKAFAAENPVSDHTANKTEFISAEKPDEAKVKEVIEAAGYTVKAVHTETV
mgnify:CR=1 FL=1